MAEYVCELPVEGMASFMSGSELIPVHERIVRCRDCKHCREHDMRAYGGDCGQLLCHHFSMSSGAGWPVEPDGFCKWGERKEVDA